MRHGQNGKETVGLVAGLRLERGHQILAQVAVAQHHTLGLARGPGSVQNSGQIIRLRFLGPTVALEILLATLHKFQRLNVHHQGQFVETLLAELVSEPLGDEYHLALGVRQDVGYLVLGAVRQDGDGHTTESGGGEEG